MIAIQLKAQGMSKTEALRKAGYSESTVRTPQKVFTSQAIMTAVDKFKLELKDAGLTTEYMASKFREWMEKGNVLEQQSAYKLYKEVVLDQELKTKPEEGQLKRRVTLEEFIGSPNSFTQAQQSPEQAIEGQEVIEAVPHIADNYPEVEKKELREKESEEVII